MKIALLDDYTNEAMSLVDWSVLGPKNSVEAFTRPIKGADIALLTEFDILCTMRERMLIDRSTIAALPYLKCIVVTGQRYDAIDVAAASDHGVVVCRTGFGSKREASRGNPVVELFWGLVIAALRDIATNDAAMRNGAWQFRLGSSLAGKTLGLVGLGKIGGEVARGAQYFGMDLVAWSPNLTQERAEPYGSRAVSKAELFELSDVIGLQMPLVPATRHIVSEIEIARMKPSAWLVNTARAGLVDNDALFAALVQQRIGGAALDVYDIEPLPADHAWRSLPNLVLSPHMGFVTREAMTAFYDRAVDVIAAFLAGAPVNVLKADNE